ncbi:MAG TPA: hypothetical protein VKB08_20975, partial [Bradyrhizobium sp.]|nr:hypothetical protein [Bradyrhizobium sp.]
WVAPAAAESAWQILVEIIDKPSATGRRHGLDGLASLQLLGLLYPRFCAVDFRRIVGDETTPMRMVGSYVNGGTRDRHNPDNY